MPTPYVTASTTYPQLDKDSAIAMTLAGMPKVDFSTLALEPNSDGNGLARFLMHATVSTQSSTKAAGVEALWDACLADGALAERLAGEATDLAQVVEGVHVRAQLPDGSTVDEGGCGGDVTPGEVFDAQVQRASDDQIVESIDELLKQNQLTAISITVHHPLGPAIAVVASVQNTDSLREQFANVQNALLGDSPPYEGVYLEIRGSDGTPLVVAATAFRAGTSISQYAPGVEDQLGILHGVDPNLNPSPADTTSQ